jgi:hypothetical protein
MNFKTFFLKEQNQKTIVLLPGGFKPPHKGHFEALKYLLRESNSRDAKVFVGEKARDGITQEQSVKIWNIYKKYINANVEIVPVTGVDRKGRPATPLSMTYDFVEDNQEFFTHFFVGAGLLDTKRFKGMELDKQKYAKTTIITIPDQFERISGTTTRQNLAKKDMSFIPEEVREKKQIKIILGIK